MVEVGGGMTAFLLVPLILLGAGLIFVVIAANDRSDTKDRSVTPLSARANHPLRHVRVAMKSAPRRGPEAVKKDNQPKRERKRRPGGRWLRRV